MLFILPANLALNDFLMKSKGANRHKSVHVDSCIELHYMTNHKSQTIWVVHGE